MLHVREGQMHVKNESALTINSELGHTHTTYWKSTGKAPGLRFSIVMGLQVYAPGFTSRLPLRWAFQSGRSRGSCDADQISKDQDLEVPGTQSHTGHGIGGTGGGFGGVGIRTEPKVKAQGERSHTLVCLGRSQLISVFLVSFLILPHLIL